MAAGLAEFGGGALLALGLITPIAAAIVIAVMTVAITTVHFSKGLWVTNGGFEYNLTLATVAFALAGVGPGRWSLDHVIGLSDHGALWAIGALVVGVVGGLGAVVAGRTLGSREAPGPRPSTA